MRIVGGTFNGTGAAVYICIGFIPDYVRMWAVEGSETPFLWYSNQFRGAEIVEGIVGDEASSDVQLTAKTKGAGIVAYEGRDDMTSTNQTSTSYGEGVFLRFDKVTDYKDNASYGYVDAALSAWTLDTSGNCTGHFNDDVPSSGTRIGEGSRILIEETVTHIQKWATIEAVTAGQGEASDEVTLSRAVKSGKILHISGMYSMIPIPVGEVSPEGFKCNLTSVINANDEIQMFEAGCYDN